MSVLQGPMRGPMGGSMVGGTRSASSGGGGSTLLVGSETVRSTLSGYLNDGYALYYPFVATASGTAATAYARLQGPLGDVNAKFLICDGSTGAVIAISSPSVVSGAGGLVQFLISASISSGVTYRIGVVCDGYSTVYTDAASWELGYQSNNYASPTSITGTGGDINYGIPELYVKS